MLTVCVELKLPVAGVITGVTAGDAVVPELPVLPVLPVPYVQFRICWSVLPPPVPPVKPT
jgi:hypothetical protein